MATLNVTFDCISTLYNAHSALNVYTTPTVLIFDGFYS